jgi:hypothetical protein
VKTQQSKSEQARGAHGRFTDIPMKCSFEGCERRAETRGMCKMHYRREMRRLRGLKRGGRYVDLTGTWGGPREDLYVDHEEFPNSDPTQDWPDHRAHWLVFHNKARGGCGESGIMNTGEIKRGDCPAVCRQGARFKAQAWLSPIDAKGKRHRLYPLTPEGSKAIGDANTRDMLAGIRGLPNLPRTKDGKYLKKTNNRGGGTGAGRARKPGAAAARAKAYRDRKREAAQTVTLST